MLEVVEMGFMSALSCGDNGLRVWARWLRPKPYILSQLEERSKGGNHNRDC